MLLPCYAAAIGAVLILTACGDSPVSVQDSSGLTHHELGFSLVVPSDLADDGWKLVADTDVSVHDQYYNFSVSAPEAVHPPLMVHAHKRAGSTRTALEQAEMLRQPTPGIPPWTRQTQSENVLPAWPDAMEVADVLTAPDRSAAIAYFARFVVADGVTISMKANLYLLTQDGEDAVALAVRAASALADALPTYRRIADSLRLE